jgi:hypothetical protein
VHAGRQIPVILKAARGVGQPIVEGTTKAAAHRAEKLNLVLYGVLIRSRRRLGLQTVQVVGKGGIRLKAQDEMRMKRIIITRLQTSVGGPPRAIAIENIAQSGKDSASHGRAVCTPVRVGGGITDMSAIRMPDQS